MFSVVWFACTATVVLVLVLWSNSGVGVVWFACSATVVLVGGRFCEVIGTRMLADPIISKSIQPCFCLSPLPCLLAYKLCYQVATLRLT